MNLVIRLLSAALVGGLLVPAFAGNGDPPASSGRTTNWVKPRVAGATAGECEWKWVVPSPPLKDDQTDDPASRSGLFGVGTTDAYAHTIADGMQFWGYAWAYDTRESDSAGAGVSSVSIGRGRIVATRKPEECVAKIMADWTPRFRLRTHVRSGLGSAGAGGLMLGNIQKLDLSVSASLDIDIQSEPLVVDVQNSYTIANVGGVSYSVARIIAVGRAPCQRSVIGHDVKSRKVSSADVKYIGNVWVSASADRVEDGEISEAEAYAWDTVPGLELHGKCVDPCSGGLTVVY